MAKLTTQDFIERARQKHGDRYDYTLVKYVRFHDKVKIVCFEHGEFEQAPSKHLHGQGCRECGHEVAKNARRFSREEFINQVKDLHGGKYDYSLVGYTNNRTKVRIICPIHGEFEQTPKDHMKGRGCVKCGNIITASHRRLTHEEFISRSQKFHDNKYDYSLVEYKNNSTNVTIICPIHGAFEQLPNKHMIGRGCHQCGNISKGQSQQLTADQFIANATAVHGDRYNYSKVHYKGGHSNVTIICRTHGVFEQMPSNHLRGAGCPACTGHERYGEFGFIERSNQVHDHKYDYSRVDYINTDTKVTIICPEHGLFEQVPFKHLSGQGCPGCAIGGFDQTKPGTLYYLRVETRNQLAYKIGITNRTIEERFQITDLDKITVLKEEYFEDGHDALTRETVILRQFAAYKYTGEPILSSGNSELFNHDILKLDSLVSDI